MDNTCNATGIWTDELEDLFNNTKHLHVRKICSFQIVH